MDNLMKSLVWYEIKQYIASSFTFCLFHGRDHDLLDGDYPYHDDHFDHLDHLDHSDRAVSGWAIENGYDVSDDRFHYDPCRDHVVRRRDVYDVRRFPFVFVVHVRDGLFLSIPEKKVIKITINLVALSHIAVF